MLISLLTFLIIGLIAGWLAGQVMKGSGFGLVGNVIIGAIGAVLGGVIFNFVGLAAYGFIGSVIMALVGAIVLLYLLRMVKKT